MLPITTSRDNWSRYGKMQMMQKKYSMMHVHWGATFEKTGDKPIEFEVTYILQSTGDEPKIIVSIAHQDEEKAMKEIGLTSS